MKKVVTIGGATRDIFITHEHPELLTMDGDNGPRTFLLLEEGKKIEVENVFCASGGGSTNAAVSFKRLGFDAYSFFKIGNDSAGAEIVAELEREGIHTLVTHSQSLATSCSVIVPFPSGDRCVMVYRGATMTVTHDELPMNHIAQSDVIYITSLSGTASLLLPIITAQAKQSNALVACNPGTSQLKAGADTLRDALKDIDILILNSDEAILLMNSFVDRCTKLQQQVQATDVCEPDTSCPQLLQAPIKCTNFCFDLELFFTEVLQQGPQIVVVTNGAEGVYGADKTGVYFHPSMQAPVVSTLGAGDSFGSCFVGSIAQGNNLPEALVKGSINSASVISSMGAKNGLLTHDELETKFKEYGIQNIQKFDL